MTFIFIKNKKFHLSLRAQLEYNGLTSLDVLVPVLHSSTNGVEKNYYEFSFFFMNKFIYVHIIQIINGWKGKMLEEKMDKIFKKSEENSCLVLYNNIKWHFPFSWIMFYVCIGIKILIKWCLPSFRILVILPHHMLTRLSFWASLLILFGSPLLSELFKPHNLHSYPSRCLPACAVMFPGMLQKGMSVLHSLFFFTFRYISFIFHLISYHFYVYYNKNISIGSFIPISCLSCDGIIFQRYLCPVSAILLSPGRGVRSLFPLPVQAAIVSLL